MAVVVETHLSGARLSRRGKVRELYDLGETLLLVASDRISAFDCVLSPGIPDKGKVLTQLSTFWFQKFPDVENHLLEVEVDRYPEGLAADRATLGYLAGSGWAEYKKTKQVCGVRLPAGLVEADRLTEPIFTPATKNDRGHDENVSLDFLANAIGLEEAGRLR